MRESVFKKFDLLSGKHLMTRSEVFRVIIENITERQFNKYKNVTINKGK